MARRDHRPFCVDYHHDLFHEGIYRLEILRSGQVWIFGLFFWNWSFSKEKIF